MSFQEILKGDAQFRYKMLDRMRSDCGYYLGNGNRSPKILWAGDEVKHIAYMKALWNSFPEDGKPEWLTYEKILEYEKEICPKAILVERDYKGEYERFALTPEEFTAEYGEFMASQGAPIMVWDNITIKPMVHISCSLASVGSEKWERFFSDMADGLSESDIKNGNLAEIRYDFMQSLKKYLPVTVPELGAEAPSLENQIRAAAQEFSNAPSVDSNREDLDVAR